MRRKLLFLQARIPGLMVHQLAPLKNILCIERVSVRQGITIHCFLLLSSCNLQTKVDVTKTSWNWDKTHFRTNKSVKKPQKQRYVVGHGTSKWSVHVRDYLFRRNISCLVWLNILGKASVSIQEVAESVAAQGCCIKTWKQMLVWMLGNMSDLMLWGFFSTTGVFPCESRGCFKRLSLIRTALTGIFLNFVLFLFVLKENCIDIKRSFEMINCIQKLAIAHSLSGWHFWSVRLPFLQTNEML